MDNNNNRRIKSTTNPNIFYCPNLSWIFKLVLALQMCQYARVTHRRHCGPSPRHPRITKAKHIYILKIRLFKNNLSTYRFFYTTCLSVQFLFLFLYHLFFKDKRTSHLCFYISHDRFVSYFLRSKMICYLSSTTHLNFMFQISCAVTS